MLKINPLSTLYVGIDVSSKSNYVCALDFYKNKYINSSFANNQPGAEELALKILECLKEHPDITTIVAALESTSVYSLSLIHISTANRMIISISRIPCRQCRRLAYLNNIWIRSAKNTPPANASNGNR